MRYISIFILGVYLFLLSGCAIFQYNVFSKAIIKDSSVKIKKNYKYSLDFPEFELNLKEVSLSISVCNSRSLYFILIPPIPWVFKEGYFKSNETNSFFLSIIINPKNNIVKLDPSKIFLFNSLEDKTYYYPNQMEFDPYFNYEKKEFMPMKSVFIEKNKFSRFFLKYNIKYFPPEETWYLSIDGLEIGGKPYSIPLITFKKSRNIRLLTFNG